MSFHRQHARRSAALPPRRVLAGTAGACVLLALGAPPAAGQVAEPGPQCPEPGTALVSDPQAFGGGGGIIAVDLDGNRIAVSENGDPPGQPEFDEPWNLALEREARGESDCDTIVVVDPGQRGVADGRVIRVDPADGTRTLVSATGDPVGGPDLVDPVGIVVEANGDLLVVDESGGLGTGALIRIDPLDGTRDLLSENGDPVGELMFEPSDVALESDGDILVVDPTGVTASGLGLVMLVDPVTGERESISQHDDPVGTPEFVDPRGLVPSGGIVVADANAFADGAGGLLRVDPLSGTRTTISENGAPSGAAVDFTGPADVAKRQFTIPTRYLVTDPEGFGGTGGVIAVAGTTGGRTVLSEDADPLGGPDFVEPWGIVIVPQVAIRRPLIDPARVLLGRRGAARRATVRFTLSRPARVNMTVHRRARGRVGAFRCVRETRRNRDAGRCVRWTRVGRLSRRGTRGRNRIPFAGRVGGEALRAGSYRLTLEAVTGGERSDPVSVEFKVRRR